MSFIYKNQYIFTLNKTLINCNTLSMDVSIKPSLTVAPQPTPARAQTCLTQAMKLAAVAAGVLFVRAGTFLCKVILNKIIFSLLFWIIVCMYIDFF